MKTLLLLATFLMGFTSISQEPDPDLYQTWFLYSYEYDLGDYILVSEIDPAISPNLIIEESLDFFGNGACNGYNGNFIYDATAETLTPENFVQSLLNCDYQSHTDFEQGYFGFFSPNGGFEYTISTVPNSPDEQELILSFAPGFDLTYRNIELSISENEAVTFKTYPNPVSETLFITSEKNTIEKLNVYSINGQLILSEKENTSQLDISALSNGLYFVEITSENGTSVERFVKK
ncbi:T9SS type A sorting domain-containing protein [uncultured Marixanthomonas sp.]|uniref:T9SS type A sorting domain-containing protein n=1 Tax=uncultured Marixanthomonas sp. TaxID=757245 RepID=UPI0030D8D7C7|tara:strand:+ start:294449 stop:295150 length:702 start_codon:yes stop_codon:yes gene_type:complete